MSTELAYVHGEGWDHHALTARQHFNERILWGWIAAGIVLFVLTIVIAITMGVVSENDIHRVPLDQHPNGDRVIARGGVSAKDIREQQRQSLLYVKKPVDRVGAMLRGLGRFGKDVTLITNL